MKKGAAATGWARKGLRHTLPLPVTPDTEAWSGLAKFCIAETARCLDRIQGLEPSGDSEEILWTVWRMHILYCP